MVDKNSEQAILDEQFMLNLPPAAQRRVIRTTCDLIELEITRAYGLEAGSLLADLPDPIESGIGPEEWRDQAERLALATCSPLSSISDPDELLRLHLEQQAKGEKDGEKES